MSMIEVAISSPTERFERPNRISGHEVMRITAGVAGVSIDDLRGKRKTKLIMFARHICYVMIKRYCPHLSWLQVSRVLGKDHTCPINSSRRVPLLLERDCEFADLYWSVDDHVNLAKLNADVAAIEAKITGEKK